MGSCIHMMRKLANFSGIQVSIVCCLLAMLATNLAFSSSRFGYCFSLVATYESILLVSAYQALVLIFYLVLYSFIYFITLKILYIRKKSILLLSNIVKVQITPWTISWFSLPLKLCHLVQVTLNKIYLFIYSCTREILCWNFAGWERTSEHNLEKYFIFFIIILIGYDIYYLIIN